MKEWAEKFYKSSAWKECRAAYAKSKGGLCEKCLAEGVFSVGEIVHHKIKLTPQNVNVPAITLAQENLELVCRECHAKEHGARKRRYKIGQDGRVIT